MARIPAWGVGPFPSPRGQLPPTKGVPGSCAPRQGRERVVTPTHCESPCLWRSPRPVPNGLCERGDSRPSFRGARHGPCHRPYSATPIRDGVQPRTGRVLVKPSPPPVHEHYCPSQRGYGFCEDGERISTTYSPPRCEPRWWAWNRPCRREATPSLPSDTLRDWLVIMLDAGIFDNVGCGGVD